MRILLVLAGDPPDSDLIKTEVSHADLVIAVDGGSKVLHDNNQKPDLIIGDLDSHTAIFEESVKIINAHDQSFTDLEKALQYISEKYTPTMLVLLGATGGRSDHLLNNLHICARIDHSVEIVFRSKIVVKDVQLSETIVRIVSGANIDLPVTEGATVSVLPVTQFTGLSIKGLLWEINGVDSGKAVISQSNISKTDTLNIVLLSGCAYIAVYQ
ncbi:MAG: thiamine diphosphokinase [Candidatus Marinimicrobia bacterium]|nr:thiamine diphosphokinase [Candidatus Neomarinimicrobiota bacterium]